MIRHRRTVLVRCYIVSTRVIGVSRTAADTQTHPSTQFKYTLETLRNCTESSSAPFFFPFFLPFLLCVLVFRLCSRFYSPHARLNVSVEYTTQRNSTLKKLRHRELRRLCATMSYVRIMQMSLKEKNSSSLSMLRA